MPWPPTKRSSETRLSGTAKATSTVSAMGGKGEFKMWGSGHDLKLGISRLS